MAQDHSVFSNIQDNRTSSLAEQVADQINQVIIDQNINAGEKLPNEFELAAHLNVGRGTIREAVKLLVARNCLEIRRGKGTFVVEKPGQIEDPLGFAYVKDKITLAVDLMELRLQLEPWVAQLAAQRIENGGPGVARWPPRALGEPKRALCASCGSRWSTRSVPARTTARPTRNSTPVWPAAPTTV